MKPTLFVTILLLAVGPQAIAGAPEPGSACAECHRDVAASFARTTHARLRAFETPGAAVGCAACHGDSAAHAQGGGAAGMRVFGKEAASDTAACLSCHASRGQGEWMASVHAAELSCTSCHFVHREASSEQRCLSCHADVEAEIRAPSHHPLKEGKLACASCHNIHASTPGALRTSERTNDLCFSCHAAMQGPFVFQHDPVEEDCMICHQPHGSAANNLLTANEPFLCLQCHELHFHTGYETVSQAGNVTVGGKSYPNVQGAQGYQQAFGTKCTQCHTQVHGSDLPSNSVPGQGANLTR